MRSIDEQMTEILKRSEKIKGKQKLQRIIITEIVSVVACLVLLITVATRMPYLNLDMQNVSGIYYGSMLLFAPTIGYIVVAVLGFLLGISVTLLCVNIKRLRKG